MTGHTPLYQLRAYFDMPHFGPRGERCHIVEDDAGHELILLQPLAEMGDGDDFDRHARAMIAAPDLLAALKRVAKKIDDASGNPHFTAAEHDKLEILIARAEGKTDD